MHIPIFPINGAVLFPKTNLPLNIFEDRYLAMVDYALSKNRMIGMIQSKNTGELFNVGCLGKIISFNETNDGRYLINLEGINCFVLKKEIKKKYNFRIVDAMILENKTKKNYEEKEGLKNKILDSYKHYIKEKDININLNEIINIRTEQLAKFIAMVSPFDDIDKQMLLEITETKVFCEKLLSILKIEIANFNQKKTFN